MHKPKQSLAAGDELFALDRRIINAMQDGFPLCDEPYRVVADQLGIAESELLARLHMLLNRGVLTRFGPLFQIERAGGSFVLAAMAVPDADFDRVAAIVNALPQVAHNYRRTHRLNMWFVLAVETPDAVAETLAHIEHESRLAVFAFPKEREYFVGMNLQA